MVIGGRDLLTAAVDVGAEVAVGVTVVDDATESVVVDAAGSTTVDCPVIDGRSDVVDAIVDSDGTSG
jgi:hypothetical protein